MNSLGLLSLLMLVWKLRQARMMDSSTSALTTLVAVSPILIGVVVSVIAAVRKYLPSIDGWKVLALAFAVGQLVGISFRLMQSGASFSTSILAEGVILGLVLAVAAVGANEKTNKIVDRHAEKSASKAKPQTDPRINGVGSYGSSKTC